MDVLSRGDRWLSIAEITAAAGISRHIAARALPVLHKMGLVERHTGMQAFRYRLNPTPTDKARDFLNRIHEAREVMNL